MDVSTIQIAFAIFVMIGCIITIPMQAWVYIHSYTTSWKILSFLLMQFLMLAFTIYLLFVLSKTLDMNKENTYTERIMWQGTLPVKQ